MQKPTQDEWKVLRAVKSASRLHGDPTLAEIGFAMVPPCTNVASVHRMIQRLVIKGWVAHRAYRARGIRLLYPIPEKDD